MALRRLIPLLMCLVPLPAMADDNAALCEMLYQRLGNAPKVIGSTDNVRAHAQALTRQNIEIRKLRLDLRRHECGSVSITMLGGPNDTACRALRQMLSTMERNREEILSRRNQARQLVVAGHEAGLIEADIEANNCAPRDPGSFEASTNPEPAPETAAITPQSPAPPKESSIVEFKGAASLPKIEVPDLPPTPERDYDPSKPVRIVGPRFFPNPTDIDLANPASGGAQVRQ